MDMARSEVRKLAADDYTTGKQHGEVTNDVLPGTLEDQGNAITRLQAL